MDIDSVQKTVAEKFLATFRFTVHTHGEFWRYRDSQWLPVPLHTIRAEIVSVVEGIPGIPAPFGRRVIATMPDRLRIRATLAANRWNTYPNLLPCRNGILDLATAQLQPDDARLYLLRTLGVNYDPAAKSPAWDKFLLSSAGASAGFLQEFAGLCLTLDTRHETAVWLHGPPGTGKSTFLSGLEVMLGDRAGVLDLAALEDGALSAAGLFGRSALLSNEQPVAGFKHDHLLNALISGEPLPIDVPRQLPGSLRASAKWIWALTHLPRVSYAGSGLFRRVRIVTFPPRALSDRDPGLKAAIAQEGPGILNWALAGLARLQARGRFEPAPAIRAADESYHLTNDPIAQFVAEKAHRHPNGSIQSSHLYTAYVAWCKRNGHPPLSTNLLAAEWQRLGFERRRVNGASYWNGLELTSAKPVASPSPRRRRNKNVENVA